MLLNWNYISFLLRSFLSFLLLGVSLFEGFLNLTVDMFCYSLQEKWPDCWFIVAQLIFFSLKMALDGRIPLNQTEKFCSRNCSLCFILNCSPWHHFLSIADPPWSSNSLLECHLAEGGWRAGKKISLQPVQGKCSVAKLRIIVLYRCIHFVICITYNSIGSWIGTGGNWFHWLES